ncbi:hypothetical protein MZM66_002479 [Enterococcus faecium]|nr:hypothetical protein [Enterococcus faecium]
MAIQSKFYKDLSKFEAVNRLGLTKRQKKMIFKMTPGFAVILGLALYLNMEGFSFWILSIVTGSFLIVPPLIEGMGKKEEIKRKIDFFLKNQDRYYQTEQIRRYEVDEFIQKKEVSEIDEI